MTEPKAPHQNLLFDSLGRRPQQRWIDAHQRREADKAAWFARAAQEVAADMARLEDLLFTRAKWKFAHTMPENPHSYTLRRQWARDWPDGDQDFQWTVQTIRIIADREKFPPSGPYARWYTVLHLRGAKFWPMNFPINYPNGRWCTILINRKPPHLPEDRR
ncbi:hypothetical protein [Luteitalea sp.]|uniref:hypothetical protein n=1 Tax=Luteitalea sp. TaxID=2004800 RepID=UPI0025C49CA9|nr:hypothetical protein [Luteitalea sp.]